MSNNTFIEVFGRRLFGWRATAALFGMVYLPPFILGVVVGVLFRS